jgi:hypothetical protein
MHKGFIIVAGIKGPPQRIGATRELDLKDTISQMGASII